MHPLLDITANPIIGHRGNAAHAPENTIESFRQAVDIGVDALELDVRLTSDGHVVVIHDPRLDRTTDRTGPVANQTLAGIRQADAGARFTKDAGATTPYRGRGITVPTLDEVFEAFPATPLLIEIKVATASRATRAVIERHGGAERCIVAAFDEHAMDAFRGSGIAQGASRHDTASLLWRAMTRRPPPRVGFNVLCMPPQYHGLPLPVGGYARVLAPLNVPVHVWTVDDIEQAKRLRAVGVRGIITNDPALIIGNR